MPSFLYRVWRWLRAEIVVGFLIATVFWAAVLGWQAAYAPTDAEKQKCHDAAEHTGHKTEECKSFWERTTSDPVAFFTFWLVISTIGLGASTLLLWRAGEKQLRHARRSSAIQSRDMRTSIEAASDANELNRQNFSKLNRPYVFVFGVKNIEPGQTEHLDALVPYFVANHGQTPALIDRMEYCLSVGNEPQATGAAWDDHPLVVSPVLGIGEKITAEAQSVAWVDSGHRVTDFDRGKSYVIPEVKIPGTAWFFWVRVFYRGPFSDGHETSGCWRYDRETCQFVQYGGTEYNYTK